MKKYLISIEQPESKRLSTFFSQSSFCKEKHNFTTFGVIGSNLSVKEYFNLAVAGKETAMTPGELGCTLSHLEALKDFLKSDEEYAIIFEDDAIERFYVDFQKLLKEIQIINFHPCFFLSLGGIQSKICDRVRGRYLEITIMGQQVLKIDPDFLEYLSAAYAYIIDRKMASLLLHYHRQPKIYDHWQGLTYEIEPFSFYATYLFEHPVIEQAVHLSYLEPERRNIYVEDSSHGKSMRYWRRKIKKILLAPYKT